ncbi:MAG: hypothetical protein C4K58_00005, partial [Flavobacteriaceae bacterium]
MKYNFSNPKPIFSGFEDLAFQVGDPNVDKEIGRAMGAFDALEKSGNFTNTINPNELTQFPVGIRQTESNVEYGIVITKAVFTPQYALINAYARVVTPQAGTDSGKKTLYFGAEGIKLSYEGKIVGDAKLSLIGDVNMIFNKNQWMLTLEGGLIDTNNGQSTNDKTYLVMDCNGVKELSLKGNVQISRELLVPIDANGNVGPNEIQSPTDKTRTIPNRVRGDFAIKSSNWNDLLVKVNLTDFAITSQVESSDKGFFSFFVNEAILDLSDLRTDSGVVFPQKYEQEGYLISGVESWRGIFVQSLMVGLPEEFKKSDQPNKRITLEAQNLLIDSYGVSGSFSAMNLFPLEQGITSNQNA